MMNYFYINIIYRLLYIHSVITNVISIIYIYRNLVLNLLSRISRRTDLARARSLANARNYGRAYLSEQREKTRRKTKRKDSTTSPLSEQLGTAGEPVIFRAEPAFISSCRIFSPATRSSKGASTSLCLLFALRIDNLDPPLVLCRGSTFSSLPRFLRCRDVARMHGYLNNREALSTDTFSLFLVLFLSLTHSCLLSFSSFLSRNDELYFTPL